MGMHRLVRTSAIVAALGVAAAAVPAVADVAVDVNGSTVNFSPPPIVQAGRVFVPLRGVFERLGASVAYSNGQINATGNGRSIALSIGSTQATVNGQSETIDVAPFIVAQSTFVPLRFLSEALGASVNYDQGDDLVSIATADSQSSYVAPAEGDVNPQDANAYASDTYASYAPPPIPQYEQPYVPVANDVWQPGYWGNGPYGYYWVPGTWVAPPRPGYLWTPGYWHAGGNGFNWTAGFWALAVGFYGGLNYGHGYYGNGYDGGRWYGNTFHYNTYVTRVNTTIIHNTYINRTVYVNHDITRIGYNGGANGVRAVATANDLAIARQRHLEATAAQIQHVRMAAQDRRLLARVNNAHPPVVAVARPLSVVNKPAGFAPLRTTDRLSSRVRVTPVAPAAKFVAPIAKPQPVAHPAAVQRPLPQARPAYRVPVSRPNPATRPDVAPAAPIRQARPPYHEPVARPAPVVQPVPAVHPAPVVHPAVNPAPVVRPDAVVHPAKPARPHAARPGSEHRPHDGGPDRTREK